VSGKIGKEVMGEVNLEIGSRYYWSILNGSFLEPIRTENSYTGAFLYKWSGFKACKSGTKGSFEEVSLLLVGFRSNSGSTIV
jgi:hypothetical protein